MVILFAFELGVSKQGCSCVTLCLHRINYTMMD